VTYGFSLSDLWAWLRYYPALVTLPDLRFSEPFETIDAHQKTIASDELGVGFTTTFLATYVDWIGFADTNHVVNVLAPHLFSLKRRGRRGPAKSPDYIALDSNLDFNVLECKGTQSSRRALDEALARGVSQKENLDALGSTPLKQSLVGGVYLPQWSSNEWARLRFIDPPSKHLSELLRQVDPDALLTAVAQIVLAKHLSLLQLPELANYLGATPTAKLDRLPGRAPEESELPKSRHGVPVVRVQREHILPKATVADADFAQGRRLTFTAEYQAPQLRRLFSGQKQGLATVLADVARSWRGRKIEFVREQGVSRLSTPSGLELELRFD
jgi:hypothetical protein